jgi:hypothetical protein
MQKLCLSVFYFFIFALFQNTLFAQDSSSAQLSQANAVAFYNRYIGENAHLYNGSEYVAYDFRIKGHPYFMTNLLQAGDVNCEGITYPSVNVSYDIIRDELITNRYDANFRIKLPNEKIAYFTLLNHFFIRLIGDSAAKSIISTGFYDRLYDGKTKLFAKRKKKIQEKVSFEEGDQLWFAETDQYYLFKDNRYYEVQNKASLLDALKDRKKDLKKFIRKNKLRFKEDIENTIVKTVQYYDQLKN